MDVSEAREASRPQSLIPHVNWAAVTTLKPRGQACFVKNTEAAQTRDQRAFHKLLETNDTFDANNGTVPAKFICQIPDSWWRMTVATIQATPDVRFLVGSWAKLS